MRLRRSSGSHSRSYSSSGPSSRQTYLSIPRRIIRAAPYSSKTATDSSPECPRRISNRVPFPRRLSSAHLIPAKSHKLVNKLRLEMSSLIGEEYPRLRAGSIPTEEATSSGIRIRNGTRTELSQKFRGKVPFPFPQIP